MAGGSFEWAMEPTAIGLVSLNSNSETHMTAICDAWLIYERGWISRVYNYISYAALNMNSSQYNEKLPPHPGVFSYGLFI